MMPNLSETTTPSAEKNAKLKLIIMSQIQAAKGNLIKKTL